MPDVPATPQRELEAWAARFAQAALEVLGGDRPVSQLLRWTNARVYQELDRRVRILARTGPAPARRRSAASETGERLIEGDRRAERGFLHVAVARRGDARRRQRRLGQPRTINPLRCPPAPEIGGFEESFGDGGEIIRRGAASRSEMREKMRPSVLMGKSPSPPRRTGVERYRQSVRQLDARARIGDAARDGDAMVGLRRRPERGDVEIADIGVSLQLAPAQPSCSS